MKAVAYVIAVLAAVGIVLVISSPQPTKEKTDMAVTQTASVTETSGELTVAVPGMHCQFACFPRVKETLEKQANVTEVALVDQPDPDNLTIKEVVVKYDAGFAPEAAIEQLRGEGFVDAAVLQ